MPLLSSLHHIVQNVTAAPDLEEALKVIVQQVRDAMRVDVCSVYLSDQDAKRHVLMATEGLRPDAVGRLQFGFGEGLVGLVAQRAEPLNIRDAPDHPRYRFAAEAGEEPFHGFLGVPLIHHGDVFGVLVVRQRATRRFSEADVAFLVTLAAQLAGTVAHAQASGAIKHLPGQRRLGEQRIEGLPGAPGVAVGTAVVVFPPTRLRSVPDRPPENPAAEETAFRSAVQQVAEDLHELGARLDETMGAEDRAIFDAYAMMIRSDELASATVRRIHEGNWAPGALRETIEEHARLFEQMDDVYLRERASDVRDLGRRILAYLLNEVRAPAAHSDNTILVGEEITAIDLAEVSPGKLAGIVSTRGSSLSHVAILAHALNVPAVMGVRDVSLTGLEGQEVVVDGYHGRVYVQPSAPVLAEFERLSREEQELSNELKGLRDLPAETLDGIRVPLFTNIGLLADYAASLEVGADGVGLYRTEVPFMLRERFPSEEEQHGIYRYVLETFAPRPVTLRTLDAGGDKALPYLNVREENPFLGWRGIRMMLDHPEIFITQLRAALRADCGLGNLSLLFPMVNGVDEVDHAKRLLSQAFEELQEEGVPVKKPPVGVMIEVPSAVYQAEELARRVDFLSVGTNDLTQYLLAIDRSNPLVAKLLDPLHPAVLRALRQIADAGERTGTPVGVCGETAGDPRLALLLLGMGIDSLSVSAGELPRIKWAIRNFTRTHAEELLAQALELDTAKSIRELLDEALEAAGLGGLIRAGR